MRSEVPFEDDPESSRAEYRQPVAWDGIFRRFSASSVAGILDIPVRDACRILNVNELDCKVLLSDERVEQAFQTTVEFLLNCLSGFDEFNLDESCEGLGLTPQAIALGTKYYSQVDVHLALGGKVSPVILHRRAEQDALRYGKPFPKATAGCVELSDLEQRDKDQEEAERKVRREAEAAIRAARREAKLSAKAIKDAAKRQRDAEKRLEMAKAREAVRVAKESKWWGKEHRENHRQACQESWTPERRVHHAAAMEGNANATGEWTLERRERHRQACQSAWDADDGSRRAAVIEANQTRIINKEESSTAKGGPYDNCRTGN